jgi:hypothetical protein
LSGQFTVLRKIREVIYEPPRRKDAKIFALKKRTEARCATLCFSCLWRENQFTGFLDAARMAS